MKSKLVQYPLRIDRLLLKKLDFIANLENRSKNGELVNLVTKRVQEYERLNGEIILPDEDTQ